MKVKGTGPSARILREALRGVESRGVVNWTGRTIEGAINAATTTNKFRQLCALSSTGISVVRHSITPVDGWLHRSTYHRRGSDFSMGSCIDDGFWTMPMPSLSEWRVHVFRSKGGSRFHPGDYVAKRIGWKVFLDEPERVVARPTLIPIRSRQFGWRLKHYASPDGCNPNLKLLARWAVCVLGWDFGAVDILHLTDRSWMVLEVNSCPGLKDTHTLNTYVQALKELGEEDYDGCD